MKVWFISYVIVSQGPSQHVIYGHKCYEGAHPLERINEWNRSMVRENAVLLSFQEVPRGEGHPSEYESWPIYTKE